MSIKIKDRLKHILAERDYLADVAKRVSSIEELAANEDLKRAVRASIEVIGEAVKTLPLETKQLSSRIEWKKIARMPDNLVHRYHDINYEIVWLVIQSSAPVLGEEVYKILTSLNREEYNNYRSKLVNSKLNSSNYFHSVEKQKEIDLAVAKIIFQEYPTKFKNVAISQVQDIVSESDQARELKQTLGKVASDNYIKQIIADLAQDI